MTATQELQGYKKLSKGLWPELIQWMITITNYFLTLHFAEAIWSLIIQGSKEKKIKWHPNYSHLMILAAWVYFVVLVLPTAQDPWQCPKDYRQDRVIQVPWKQPEKQEQFPTGSRSPHRCSIAGGHSLHKEGACATCHRAQEVTGHTKGSCQTRLPPQITPQW